MTNWVHVRFGGKRGLFAYFKYSLLQLLFRRYKRFLRLPHRKIGRVVFVCKGNICRSAFAEAVFKSVSDIPAVSFGLDTTTGCAAHPPVIRVARTMGYELNHHVTTNVTEFIPKKDDLYVCMEVDHAITLESLFDQPSIILLGSTGSPRSVYIHDPFSGVEGYVSHALRYICGATKMLSDSIDRAR